MAETNEHGQTFAEWKRQVSANVEARAGLGCDDLPDYCYRDMFDDGIPADDEDMIDEILENAGW